MAHRSVRREWHVIQSLSSVLKPHRWLLPVVLAFGLLASALEGIGITLLIPLLHTFSKSADSNLGESFPVKLVWAGIHAVRSRVQFLAIIGGIFAVVCLKNIFAYANTAIFSYVESRASHELRLRVFERVVAMPLAQAEADQSGRLYNVLNTETWRTGQALNIFFGSVANICTVTILFLLLLCLSWRLTVISFLCVAAIPIVSSMLGRRASEIGRKTVEANCDLSNRIWSTLNGLRVIHGFGQEKFEVHRFDRVSRRVRDPYIFDDTIRFNLLYGRPQASQTEIERSAQLADADGFIRALPRDEATNSVDSVTEQRLQQSLLSTAGDRRIIMVAHRLASIEWADNIPVFDRGRLVEQGSFSELIACNVLFARCTNYRASLAFLPTRIR
jgi:ABC-type multidrug transport system fused ATPase/permease subunit